ncbi:MAG TPA: hypothetical protein VFY39_12975, partial [Gammaproteobacteria bacterium]|nr:hypothetical protein [Gammaproteobacteria bacterium]
TASEYSRLTAQSSLKPARDSASSAPRPERIGGAFWDGATAVARSPYLLGIGAYIAFLAISNTLIYFAGANIVLDNTDTLSQRVGGFAQFDLLANIVTLFTQIFITTRLIRRIGVGWTLSVLPLVTVAGFAVLAVWPLFGVMALFQAVSRATRYAVSRPSRETLFSVVPPAEKYKAKPMIDVFVYRGGDVAGAAFDAALRALGLPLIGVAAAAVPVAGIWTLLCLALGRTQQRRDRELKRLAAGETPAGAEEAPRSAESAEEPARLVAGAGRQP